MLLYISEDIKLAIDFVTHIFSKNDTLTKMPVKDIPKRIGKNG